MKRDHQDFSERIDRYLREELTAEEKIAFQIEMEANPKLAEEVAIAQDISKMLQKKKSVADFRAMQAEVEAELVPAPASKPAARFTLNSRLLLRTAAAVAAFLLVAAGYLYSELREVKTELATLKEEFFEADLEEDKFFVDEEKKTPVPNYRRQYKKLQGEYNELAQRIQTIEDVLTGRVSPLALGLDSIQTSRLAAIADQYLKPAKSGAIAIAAQQGDANDSLSQQSFERFYSGDFEDALIGFEEMTKRDTLKAKQLLFPMGICYLDKDISESIELLEKAFAENKLNISQFHLAMAYLKKGQLEDSRRNLEEIVAHTSDMEDEYRVKATEVLKELKEKI